MKFDTGRREELMLVCERLYRLGLQTGMGGNVSARIPDTAYMYVKKSGVSFADIQEDSFIIADFNGNKKYGEGIPTRESILHGYLYQSCPHVNAIVHIHTPYAITWSLSGGSLPRITWEAKLKITCDIPNLQIPSAAVRQEDLPQLEAMLANSPQISGFLLHGHGLVAMGDTPREAGHQAEWIEEAAHIALLSGIAYGPVRN